MNYDVQRYEELLKEFARRYGFDEMRVLADYTFRQELTGICGQVVTKFLTWT